MTRTRKQHNRKADRHVVSRDVLNHFWQASLFPKLVEFLFQLHCRFIRLAVLLVERKAIAPHELNVVIELIQYIVLVAV